MRAGSQRVRHMVQASGPGVSPATLTHQSVVKPTSFPTPCHSDPSRSEGEKSAFPCNPPEPPTPQLWCNKFDPECVHRTERKGMTFSAGPRPTFCHDVA